MTGKIQRFTVIINAWRSIYKEREEYMLENIFHVSANLDRTHNRPHYPRYKTEEVLIGAATSLERAVEIIKATVSNEFYLTHVHHFTVREVLPDETYYWWEYETIRIYDRNGDLIDQILTKYRTDICERFYGRRPEDIRFMPGDIVEVLGRGGEISLAFVAYQPPSVEKAARCTMDTSDDCYVVLTQEDYRHHEHVDSVSLFKPQHKMHPGIEARLRKAYRDFQTFEKRQEIAMATAVARLKCITEEIGCDASIKPYYDEHIDLKLSGLPGKEKELRIRIDADIAFQHMDRVRITLCRLAGITVKGRGYGLRQVKEGWITKCKDKLIIL